MADEFTARQLTLAINRMKPAPTKVLDTVFGRKKRQLTGTLKWEVKDSSGRLLSNISTAAPATVRGGIGRKVVTCSAPRFAEKELISADDLKDMRAFGSVTATELLKERIGDEQADMKTSVDLTREFMAVKALSGQVVDKDGTVLVDFNLPAAHKPTLTGTALWTDAASDPVKNLRVWKKMISQQAGPVTGFAAFCGSGAMDALINNDNARELLRYSAGQQIAEEGRIARLAKVNIDEYDGTYTDDSGVMHDLIPDNVFALVGLGPQIAAELFAPVIDLEAPAGVGKGKPADMFFSKMWEENDPSGRWVKVEARPLPVMFQPLAVIWAVVV